MNKENQRGIAIAYIKELKPFIMLSLALFALSVLAGVIYYIINPSYALGTLSGLEDIVDLIKDFSIIEIMLFIFINNAVKMLFAILLGFALGIFPFFFLVMNGFIIGVFAHFQTVENGLLFIMAGLLPHGIIEIPLLIVSSAIGLKIGYVAMQFLRSRPGAELRSEINKGVRFYFRWMLPLVFLAAAIETFITPLFIYFVAGP